jgi:hypothetical protein
MFTFANNAGEIYRRLRVILEHGLEALSGKPPPVRRRLEEARDLIAHVEQVIPAALEGFVADVGSRNAQSSKAAS